MKDDCEEIDRQIFSILDHYKEKFLENPHKQARHDFAIYFGRLFIIMMETEAEQDRKNDAILDLFHQWMYDFRKEMIEKYKNEANSK